MSGAHLSQLCSGEEIEPIHRYLQEVAPDTTECVEDDNTEDFDQVIKYVNGVWGFRDSDGRTAFHWAIALKNYSLAHTLMNETYKSPVLSEDEDGVTPFMTACMVGASQEFVSLLLEKSVAVYHIFLKSPMLQNQRSKEDKLVDHKTQSAERKFHTNELSSVKNTRSNDERFHTFDSISTSEESVAIDHIVNAQDSLGNTPLLHVVSRGHDHLVDFLLKNGADLDHQNRRGQSALHRSVGSGNVGIVEKLLYASKKKADRSNQAHRRWINLQDDRGDTALFYASYENNEDLGRLLLQNGADRYLRNKEGKEFWQV